MAFITADIKSPSLTRTMTVRLYFPTDLPESVGNKVKGVITLLHGIGNSGADWVMYSAAIRYAADNGYILIMPNAENSFYVDMAYGAPYFTLLTEELPRQLQSIFKIPTEREKNFIAGLSMGGYGAALIGLTHPERYAAIGCFSGALDMAAMLQAVQQMPPMRPAFASLFGEGLALPDEANLVLLAKRVSKLPKEQQPRIFCTCGEQDNDLPMVLTQNLSFRDAVQGFGLDYTLQTWPGVHEWNFWDRSLAEFIGHIQNSDYALRKRQDWNHEIHVQT